MSQVFVCFKISSFAADIKKGFIAHDTDEILLFYLKKKITKYLEKCCVQNQRPCHSDEL
jgi:hypothetical protein